MNLLDKFAAVEIKAGTRISEADRAFCLRQQEAFDRSGPALQRVADAILEADAQQDAIFEGHPDEFRGYTKAFQITPEKVYDAMTERNRVFIRAIVNHFAAAYSVSLSADDIEQHLIPAMPEEPRYPYVGWGEKPSDKEVEEYRAKLEVFHQEQDAWAQRIRALPLRYEQVVDEIVTQLGGFSFREKAINELLERLWKATHYTSFYWGRDINPERERFEVKNATIHFQDCVSTNWDNSVFRVTDSLRAILDGLAFYECGEVDYGQTWYSLFFQRYELDRNVFETPHSARVDTIRLFKNGRADIKFRSPAFAQEFAARFLRERPGGQVRREASA